LGEHREQYKKDHPDAKVKEITQALAKEWNELSEKEKQPFNDRFKAAKVKYDGLFSFIYLDYVYLEEVEKYKSK
jgi:hypothetical protein